MAIVLLASEPSAQFSQEEKLRRTVLLAGILVTGAGTALPWGRVLRERSPGRTLGFVSKLLGWIGVGALPAAIVLGNWPLVPLCVLMPVSAFSLWKVEAWAAWTWYAVAAGCFVASALVLVQIVSRQSSGEQPTAYERGQAMGSILGVVLYSGVGVTLVREVNAWRRRRSSGEGPPTSS